MAKNPPNRKGPARAPAQPSRRPAPPGRGRPAGLFTWLAIGLVVVVVATLVIVKVTSNSGGGSGSPQAFSPVDATTFRELTTVPESVFDTVGVTSTVAAVSPPVVLKNQPALTSKSATGASLPEVLYIGANYCPFCAAERWASIIALSRFGTWSGLGNMESSTHVNEIYPGTPTFTFEKAKYSSPYLSFSEVEEFTNQWDASLNPAFYSHLQTPTKAQQSDFAKYDTSRWIPGFTSQQDGSIPFYSFGNQVLIAGSSYTPALLANQTRSQIASGLTNTSSPITAAIISTANYIAASVCVMTHNKPGSVCSSKGVKAAKKVMKVS